MRTQKYILVATVLSAAALFGGGGCGEGSDGEDDFHAPDEEGRGVVDSTEEIAKAQQLLKASDPISKAIADTCSTSVANPLSEQLISEIQCLKPGVLTSIANVSGTKRGASVFPYLQTPAAKTLSKVVAARGTTMQINSALRSLPAQFMLYQYYLQGRCGISLAAKPGTSNHEQGLALDVNDNAGWRNAFQGNGWKWLGAKDPVHYDFVGGGGVNLGGLSVRAFQRLWNRNHPEDLIDEDGSYGPQTEARIKRAPIGGFTKGALKNCSETPDAGAAKDAGTEAGAVEEADAGDEDASTPPTDVVDPPPPPADHEDTTEIQEGDAATSPEEGCSLSRVGSQSAPAAGSVLLAVGALAFAMRRRAR